VVDFSINYMILTGTNVSFFRQIFHHNKVIKYLVRKKYCKILLDISFYYIFAERIKKYIKVMKKLGLLVLAVLMISLSSCGNDHAEKAKNAAGEAVQATKDAANEAAEATKEAASDAVDATKEAADKAVDAAKDAVGAKVDGKALFASNGCTACHNMDKKTVGPAVKEIGGKYAGKKDALVKFLKGEGEAIVDPAQFAVMKPNLEITKKLNDAQRAAIADYFLNAK